MSPRHLCRRVLLVLSLAPLLLLLPSLAHAQTSFVGFVQGNYATPQTPETQTTVSVAYMEAQAAGNLNVVVVGWNDSTATVQSVTDANGNTYVLALGPTVQTDYASQAIYYAKNIAAAAANANTVTVTFSTAAIYPDVRIAEYAGVDPSNPVDVTVAAQGYSSTSDSGPVTTTNANDLLVGANIVEGSSTGPGGVYTERMITDDGDILEDQPAAAVGSYNATAVLDWGPQHWIMQLVAFRLLSSTSFVQGNFADPQTPQTSVSVSFTGAQGAGDLDVVVVGSYDSTPSVQSVTDSQGNTYALAVGPTVQTGVATQSIYYAKNIAAAAANANTVTVTFNSSATYPDVRIAEYTAIDTANPLDVSVAAQGSGLTSDSGFVTTTNTEDLLVGANLTSSWTSNSGADYTNRMITDPDSDILEDRLVAATGSYHADAPLGDTGTWIMQLVAFRTAAATPHITSISPTLGPVGTSVTITGTNFGSSQSSSTVAFNGTTATPCSTCWSATSIVAAVPSGATTGNVVVTVGGKASNGVSFTVANPPSIFATASPAPNSAGWNNSSVTVTFTCTPGSAPITSCPSPQTVTAEGSGQVISGTATDANGLAATASRTVNIDKSAPTFSAISPADGATVSSSPVTLTATLTDALSGVSAATCNGANASLSAGNFSCNISLGIGVNLVVLRVTDLAGNVAGANLHLTLSGALPSASSLQITPGRANVLVGGTQQFTAIDQAGRPRSDASWTVDNTNIATISTDSSPTLTGVSPGVVDLTASVGGTSIQVQVTVVSGASLPVGTPIWTAPPLSGFTGEQIAQAVPTSNGTPDIYTEDADNNGNRLVRAFTSDGQQLWQASPGTPSDSAADYLSALVPDNLGGTLVRYDQAYSVQNPSTQQIFHSEITTYADLDGTTGSREWNYVSLGNLSLPAVRQDGTIFFAETLLPDINNGGFPNGASLLALDGTVGAPIVHQPLPASDFQTYDSNNQLTSDFTSGPQLLSNLAIDSTGNVALLTETETQATTFDGAGDTTAVAFVSTLSLFQLKSDGSTSLTTIRINRGDLSLIEAIGVPRAYPQSLIPDGQGGWLAAWADYSQSPALVHVTHLTSNGQTDNSFPSLFRFIEPMVLGENAAYITDGQFVIAFDATSLSPLWTFSSSDGLAPVMAVAGGAVIINDSQTGLVSLDSSGNPTTFQGTANSTASPWTLGNWMGSLSSAGNALAEFAGPSTVTALSAWPEPDGNSQKQNAPPKPTVAHFAPASVSDLGIASYDAFTSGMTDTVPKSKANHEFIYTGQKATPEYFLATLAKPIAAVGFVGHSFDIDATPPFSVGLQFSTTSSALVRPSLPTDNPTYTIDAPNTRLVLKSQINTQAKVVFIAACFTGPAFTSLWNIQSGTAGQALIVLNNPSTTVLLGHGLVAWERILDDLVNSHMTVAAAVQEANTYLPSINVQERYTVVGDPNVKLVP